MYFKNLYLCLSSLFFLIIQKKNNNLVIYSENIYYFSLFEKIIKNLSQDNIKISYLTSDINEFNLLSSYNIEKYFIGNGLIRALIFFFIRSQIFLLTLSDLDNYELKKSKYCNNYFYLFHSLQSSHVQYSFNAFQNYDLIFCNGEYHKKEIEQSEKIFKFKKKKCVVSGNTYFDFLLDNKKNINQNPKSILIAPSWNLNENNFFNIYCSELIGNLLKKNLNCIFRPHPMHYIKSKKIIDKILKKYGNEKNFRFDYNKNNFDSLSNSKVLITDNSGIANEFILAFNRRVIFFNFQNKIHNEQFKKINLKSFEEKVKDEFGYIIQPEDISNIEFHLNKVLLNEITQKKLDEFLKKYISNVGSSVNIITKEIKKKLKDI